MPLQLARVMLARLVRALVSHCSAHAGCCAAATSHDVSPIRTHSYPGKGTYRMYKLTSFRASAAIAALLLVTTGLQAASAASTMSSNVDAFLFLVDVESTGNDVSGLTINGSDFLNTDELAEGNAVIDNGGTLFYLEDPLGLGVGFDISLNTYAEAAAQATGFAELGSLAFGFVDLANDSVSDSYTVSYGLSYTLDSAASTGFGLSDAFTVASLSLGQDGIQLFNSSTFADALIGPATDSDTGTFLFSVSLAPGESASLTLRANSFGVVEAVPVPAALPLLGSGLVALFGLARRRLA